MSAEFAYKIVIAKNFDHNAVHIVYSSKCALKLNFIRQNQMGLHP